MKTNELREMYLSFFESKGCVRRPSDVLVPKWDPSVLFTPAGMNQFKDHFLGRCKLEFTRATTCQKCLRTGDIDNVGRTAYHHTFFEMLGNFSFGDYFKREAIHWAWEFLTSPSYLNLPKDTLSVTVYKTDQEAYDIWNKEVGLAENQIERKEEDENFWPASAPSEGPDGVCGPCSEIYYHTPLGEVEIWNLVFTQFERKGEPTGTLENGLFNNLFPLPSKNIDTGMGLERCASALQGCTTNYHIDILRPIVEAAGDVCGVKYVPTDENGRRLRRIADHVRACTFAIHENVYPGANKEEYVVKRLLRRGVLDGRRMGLSEPFLWKVVPAVIEQMKVQYPELVETQEQVQDVIRREEANFLTTVDNGLGKIERVFNQMKAENRTEITGDEAAEMYTTFGFPPELFETIAAERNFSFDWDGYKEAMRKHGEESGAGKRVELFKSGPIEALKSEIHNSKFVGYETLTVPQTVVLGIISNNKAVSNLTQGAASTEEKPVMLVLGTTPFYGEMGGQIGDTGWIRSNGDTISVKLGDTPLLALTPEERKLLISAAPAEETGAVPFEFEVTDTQNNNGLLIHIGHLRSGAIRVGQIVSAEVDEKRRHSIERAHSATHLLHSVLQKYLGSHAQQRGSKVTEDTLRFDFSNPQAVPTDILLKVGKEVNQRILEAAEVSGKVMPLEDARKSGAMMLFGEKYPDDVRVVTMGESKELCGGTHVTNIAKIGAFKILSEESVSTGTRRITAITGMKVLEYMTAREEVLTQLAQDMRSSIDELPVRVEALQKEVKQLRKELAEAKKQGGPSVEELAKMVEERDGYNVLTAEVAGGPEAMRELSDQLLRHVPRLAVMLGSQMEGGKAALAASISRDLLAEGFDAAKWIRTVSKMIQGGGGGRPEFAQAGGKDGSKLAEALETAKTTVK
ncbi:MAG: alanine--tRNA ligase [Planctomycetia bacterium]|nr:alanine--tRNA ligase [Planctomycetia bacterium]